MNGKHKAWLAIGTLSIIAAACGGGGKGGGTPVTSASPDNLKPPVLLTSPNSSGVAATYTASGSIDQSNAFFKPFGNGRSCATCHQQNDGWSLTPASVQATFARTSGNDPLFIAMDGANRPDANISTPELKRAAYSMLLTKGVIRIGLPIPADAEFDLAEVDDPYGFASSAELSLFRRPLPATNLKFLSTVMWDARDTHKDANSNICFIGTNECYSPLDVNLARQANRAVRDHAQATADLTSEEQAAIVSFQRGLFTAQLSDLKAKSLTGAGATGGPLALADTDFYFGINDLDAGDYKTPAPFNARAMTMFNAWSVAAGTDPLPDPDTPAAEVDAVTEARRAIARGQAIFNSRDMFITEISGMNSASIRGSCTTCHNAPNSGGHATPLMVDIGVSAASRRTPDMPLYTLRNKVTGETVQTTDPGLAMQSGKWEEIGRFKVPVLRALASRAPYFHDGSAHDLGAVVDHYNTRFDMKLSPQEISVNLDGNKLCAQ